MSDVLMLTEAAATKVKALAATEPDFANLALRVAVAPGGCSGFRYELSLDDAEYEGDVKAESFGVKLVTDAMSYPYVKGSTIDFVETLQQMGFTIDNPNVTASCRCGNSFQAGEETPAPAGCGCGNC
ncbi:MAG: iron-sulfur cluster assembly accessory protein [Propionibacteriaceae bacterium]|jgi:iron-sulfur cluster assembly accessory protein|nr:iron-sulfur cluster assembly accessory protein [Propionibacteriaceae bacterium]